MTPFVPFSSITRVREVQYILDRHWDPQFTKELKRKLVAVEFGEWITLNEK